MRERPDAEQWRRLRPYLDRALDLTEGERGVWLRALEVEDAGTAAGVEALLAERTALSREGFLDAGPALPSAETSKPDRIGPYRFVRELGRGGTGRVYLAEQEGEGFRRQVAVKLVDTDAPRVEARFRDERRILAGLEHPGIARLYDAGRSPDGPCFLIMEYVEGANLLDHARAGNMSIPERLRLFLAVLEAVEFAHARRVIHRDLKPSNILVGADGRPRLLDFGIAKLLEADPDLQSTDTRTQFRALTPAYASPEQFRGERVTPAADVFSLGVLLYELLMGVRPFAPPPTTPEALQRAVLEDDPPSLRSSGLDRDLQAICLKALRKEPPARYASAASFAADLRSHLEGRPVAARADSRRYRVACVMKRHRGRLLTAAALSLAAAALVFSAGVYRGVGIAPQPKAPASPIRSLAVLPRTSDAYDAYLRGEHFFNQWTEQSINKAAEYFRAAVKEDPAFVPAQARLAEAYAPRIALGYVPPGRGLAEMKAAARRALALDPGLGSARAALANALTLEWDWGGAEAEFQRALETDPNSALAHLWYGWLLRAQARFDESATHRRRALELDPLSVIANVSVAVDLGAMGRDDEAMAQWNRTLELEPDRSQSHARLALYHLERGRIDEGLRHLEHALARSPDDPTTLAAAGLGRAVAGDAQNARQLLRRLEADSARRYVSPVLRAFVHGALGERDRAFALLEEAYAAEDPLLVPIQVDERASALRSDPRFRALVRRMGLAAVQRHLPPGP